jgi:hypothetical protein
MSGIHCTPQGSAVLAKGWGHQATLFVLLGLCLLPTVGQASLLTGTAVATLNLLSASPTPGDSSIQARLKACILAGDLQCVVTQYLLLKDIGRVPGWLVSFQNAFAAINREAGKCESVARTIHEGLTRLGQRPEYLRITVQGHGKILGFDEVSQGLLLRTHQVSITGYHVAIKLDGKVIDAYTGFAGLPIHEYMARLSASPGSKIVEEVVQTL